MFHCYFQIIPNVTRELHNSIVRCEAHNDVGRSEDSETLDVACEYMFIICYESFAKLRSSRTMSKKIALYANNIFEWRFIDGLNQNLDCFRYLHF